MLIKDTDWCKQYKHNIDLTDISNNDKLLIENSYPYRVRPDDTYFDEHKFWEFDDDDLYNAVNQYHELNAISQSGMGKLRKGKITIWEMRNNTKLHAHVDSHVHQGFVIMPLIGKTRTACHGPIPDPQSNIHNTPYFFELEDYVEDYVEYEPGQMVVINNTKFVHSVVPLDGYRLALQFPAKHF